MQLYPIARFFLFLLPPECAHKIALSLLRLSHRLGLLRKPCVKHARSVFGLHFDHPVGIAAGLDKNGDYIDCLAALGVGFIEVGAVTPVPQPGNPKPRLFRLPKYHALINRMGFNNKGVDYLVANLKKRKAVCPVGVNLGKNKATPLDKAYQDYVICLEKIYPYADFATINISSPNTPGLRELQSSGYISVLLTKVTDVRETLRVKHGRRLPIIVKISPDMTEQQTIDVLRAVKEAKLDGIMTTNTTQDRTAIQDAPVVEEQGGLSGQPLKELSRQSLRWSVASQVDLPIISVGGIDSKEEVYWRLNNGAQLVQIYTGLIYHGPKLIRDII